MKKLQVLCIVLIFIMLSSLTSTLTSYAANETGRTYYIDCSLSSSGDGSLEHPIARLAAANELDLQPGDSVLFKRGTTCYGQYAPTGSGTANLPILIDAYGPAEEKPLINANGETNAVQLKNMSFVQIRNLALTAPGDNLTPRRGLHVYGYDAGDLPGIVIEGLTIFDVRGQMPSTTGGGYASGSGKFGNASGGIIIEVQGSTTPTAFHNMKILNNHISSVDREGIYFWSNWCKRPELSRWANDCSASWYPHTNILVQGNELHDIGGDGIVPKMMVGGLVEHNVLKGFNVRAIAYNAGMWTANSDHITFQYNETSGGVSTLDGMAYDIDHATNHILFQYNLSYNNEGGFFLFCPDSTANTRDFIVRYNISINDQAQLFLQGCGGKIVNGQIYNNTMMIGDGLSPTVYVQSGAPIENVEFFNNIVYKVGAGSAGWSLNNTQFKMDHNLFYNLATVPNWATNTITEDPLFMNSGTLNPKGYKLGINSAALRAGVLISENGGLDFYGNPVSASEAPNIGAFEGEGVLPTPEEGCTPLLQSTSYTLNGQSLVKAVITNPCIGDFTDLNLTVSKLSDPGSSTNVQIDRLAEGESITKDVALSGISDKAIGIYPIVATVRNAEDEILATSHLNVEWITPDWKTVASEGFDDMTVGQSPAGWETSGNHPPIVVEEGDHHALKLVQSGGAVNRSVWSFPEQAGMLKLTTRVLAGQRNMPLGVHYLDANNGEVLKLSLNLLGTVSYTQGGAFVDSSTSYGTNQWLTLEAFVDRDSSSYIVFLDGVRVGQGTLGPSTNPISRLRLQVPAGSATGSFLVDHVTIEVPDEPPIEDVFSTVLTGPTEVRAGEAFEIQYGVEKAPPFTAQDLTLRYDADSLQYIETNALAPGLIMVSEEANEAGTIRLIIASTGINYAIDGDQPELLKFVFQARSGHSTSAEVEVIEAVFGNAEGHEFNAREASYEVIITHGINGDLNDDGRVSVGDLAIMASHYGKDSSSPDWEQVKRADLNGDGKIDIQDLAMLAQKILE